MIKRGKERRQKGQLEPDLQDLKVGSGSGKPSKTPSKGFEQRDDRFNLHFIKTHLAAVCSVSGVGQSNSGQRAPGRLEREAGWCLGPPWRAGQVSTHQATRCAPG